jgi:hypothetical protein
MRGMGRNGPDLGATFSYGNTEALIIYTDVSRDLPTRNLQRANGV